MATDFNDQDNPLFMISVAATMIAVHPQTLRLYERLGLITPQRTKGKTRLYSQRNIEQLRLIRNLTRDRGVNLAGVDVILKMQNQLHQLQQEMRETLDALQKRPHEEPSSSHPLSNPPKADRTSAVRIRIERG